MQSTTIASDSLFSPCEIKSASSSKGSEKSSCCRQTQRCLDTAALSSAGSRQSVWQKTSPALQISAEHYDSETPATPMNHRGGVPGHVGTQHLGHSDSVRNKYTHANTNTNTLLLALPRAFKINPHATPSRMPLHT